LALGRLVDQLTAASMVQVAAWTDPAATHLRLTFPDGTVVDDEVRLAEPVETEVHKRTAVGHVVDGPWAEPLSAFLGRDVRLSGAISRAEHGPRHPTSLVTDGSLAALEQRPRVGDVDARRFRMLIELEDGAAHEEDTWVGCRVGLGGTICASARPCRVAR